MCVDSCQPPTPTLYTLFLPSLLIIPVIRVSSAGRAPNIAAAHKIYFRIANKKDLPTMVSRQGLPACYTFKDDMEDDSDDSASDEVPEYYYGEVHVVRASACAVPGHGHVPGHVPAHVPVSVHHQPPTSWADTNGGGGGGGVVATAQHFAMAAAADNATATSPSGRVNTAGASPVFLVRLILGALLVYLGETLFLKES